MCCTFCKLATRGKLLNDLYWVLTLSLENHGVTVFLTTCVVWSKSIAVCVFVCVLKCGDKVKLLASTSASAFFSQVGFENKKKKTKNRRLSEKPKKKNLSKHSPLPSHSLYAWLAASYYLQVSRAISKQCVIYSSFFFFLYVCNLRRRRRGRQPDCQRLLVLSPCLADALLIVLRLPFVSVTLSLSSPVEFWQSCKRRAASVLLLSGSLPWAQAFFKVSPSIQLAECAADCF